MSRDLSRIFQMRAECEGEDLMNQKAGGGGGSGSTHQNDCQNSRIDV
jgi:hypothetical protein